MLTKDPDPDIIIFRGRKGSREPRSSHVRQPASGIAQGLDSVVLHAVL